LTHLRPYAWRRQAGTLRKVGSGRRRRVRSNQRQEAGARVTSGRRRDARSRTAATPNLRLRTAGSRVDLAATDQPVPSGDARVASYSVVLQVETASNRDLHLRAVLHSHRGCSSRTGRRLNPIGPPPTFRGRTLRQISRPVCVGARRNAASQLRWRDVDLEEGRLRLREKGRKVVGLPMPHELVAILAAAFESGQLACRPDDYVIPNRRPASVRRAERSNPKLRIVRVSELPRIRCAARSQSRS